MNTASLGKTLGLIRRLRSLSVEESDTALGVPPGTTHQAETGHFTESLLLALSRLHGLDADLLEEGQVKPVVGVHGATVFLLHSGNLDFSSRDLGALEEGLVAGQLLVPNEGAALATRGAFAPVNVAGPGARDAARQGYRLANRVRSTLQLGSEPIGDLGAILQQQLCVALFVTGFPSGLIEAASIVDSRRLAACAMIAADQVAPLHPRTRNLLAHELCHILFDAGRPGTVRLSLHQHERNTALEESRARGFAAEFLLPRSGLEELLGAPRRLESEDKARQLVDRAREHFRTTIEMTAWHLKNHEFIARDVSEQVIGDKVGEQLEVKTSLPAKGVFPADPPKYAMKPGIEMSVALSHRMADQAPKFMSDAAMHLLDRARKTPDELAATDELVQELDRHLSADNTALFARVLQAADCSTLRRSELGGLLLLAKAAGKRLPRETAEFRDRGMEALAQVLTAEELDVARKQFA